jgi:lipoate-protein ligase A
VGKHQNIFAEVRYRFAVENNIQVVRRISGGGSVYHDLGNLNFSFITRFNNNRLSTIKIMPNLILNVLHEFNIDATLNEKNDILIGTQKISGSSQITNMRKVINHGTLLFNSHLPTLYKVLSPDTPVRKSDGIKSIRSKVSNVVSFLQMSISLDEFKTRIINKVSKNIGKIVPYKLTPQDWKNIFKLAKNKYRSWEWNYGLNPEFTTEHIISGKKNGYEPFLLTIKKGLIRELSPLNNLGALSPQMEQLIKKRYNPLKIK